MNADQIAGAAMVLIGIPGTVAWALMDRLSPLPRRPEPGVSALGSSEGDDEWVDEDGWDRTPGQEPREVGLP